MRRYDGRNYDGKVVAHLKYRLHDADVSIPVRLVQNTQKVEQSRAPYRGKGSKPTHTTACIFRVYFEEIGLKPGKDEPDSFEATDIEILRATVMGKLDAERELDWEDWLLVHVSEGYRDDDREVNLKLKWERIYVATLADGRKVHRYGSYRRNDTIHDGVPATGWHGRHNDEMRALIRATDENEAALGSLRDRVVEVRKMMMDFMSPKKIEDTLARATDRLLPRPKRGK